MKTIQKTAYQTLALTLLLSGASAYSMINPATLKFLSRVGSGVTITGLSFAGNMGADYYKGLQMPDTVSAPPLLDNQLSLPSNPITDMPGLIASAPERSFGASADETMAKTFSSMLEASIKYSKDISATFMAALKDNTQRAQNGDRGSQLKLSVGTMVTVAAVGVASYYCYKTGRIIYNKACIAGNQIREYGINGWMAGLPTLGKKIEKLETQASQIIKNIGDLDNSLKAAIKDGNETVIANLTGKIKATQAELKAKIAAIESSITTLSAKTDSFHATTTGSIADLKKILEGLKAESKEKLDTISTTLEKHGQTLDELKASQDSQTQVLAGLKATMEASQVSHTETLARLEVGQSQILAKLEEAALKNKKSFGFQPIQFAASLKKSRALNIDQETLSNG